MFMQIFGTGCAKSAKLEENAALAIQAAGVDCRLEKVTDPARIQAAGVMITPALVIDGSVKLSGRVAEPEEIRGLLLAAVGGNPSADVTAAGGCGCGSGPVAEKSEPRRSGGCGCGCEGGPAAKYFRFIALALVVVLLIAIFSGRFRQGEKPQESKVFRPVVLSGQGKPLPRLVVLGSAYCPPCLAMGPTLADLQKEYAAKVAVEYYDVTVSPELVKKFGAQETPTLIYLDAAGREVGRSAGYQTKEAILQAWKVAGIAF